MHGNGKVSPGNKEEGMSQVTAPTPLAYPASLNIDYPDKSLNRLTSFFRIFTVIPIAIILGMLTNAGMNWGDKGQMGGGWEIALGSAGFLFLPLVLMILFKKKYPKWWFNWNLELAKFGLRVESYLLLLRDEYPSTDEEQAVHVELAYPDAQKLGRGMPLVKWFLAIPHYIVLFFLGIAVIVCWIIAWFAILFTGRYPKGLFDFIVGVLRWSLRVQSYAIILITDKYPPFSMES
jgi:hypothetical protein